MQGTQRCTVMVLMVVALSSCLPSCDRAKHKLLMVLLGPPNEGCRTVGAAA